MTNKIKFEYKNHILINGVINDSMYGNFVFDSGAYGVYLDSTYFSNSKLNNKNVESYKIRGVGENFQEARILQDSISIGINSIRHYQKGTPVLNLKKLGGKNLDAIIGYSFFENDIIEIDYEKNYIKIINSFDSNLAVQYTKFPIRIENWKLLVFLDIQVCDSINLKGEFLLDTGSSSTISMNNSLLCKFNLKDADIKRTEYYSNNFGIGGNSSGFFFQSKNISFSNFNIRNQIINFSYDKKGTLSNQVNVLGVIGNRFLENFNVIIDFPNKLMYLKPNEKYFRYINKTKRTYSLGFTFVNRIDINKGWIVNSLIKKSNAESSGLLLNDIITHINGVPVDKLDEIEFHKNSRRRKLSLKLKIQRDEILKVLHFKTNKLNL